MSKIQFYRPYSYILLITCTSINKHVPICSHYCTYYLIKNTPSVKKKRPKTKTGLTDKVVKSNGRPMPTGFDRFESFDHDELNAKHCYFRCSRLLMLMGSKFLIKMARPQSIKIKNSVLQPGHLYQNFDPINIRRP